jgi:DNA-binding NarL/FixJ family response regulator
MSTPSHKGEIRLLIVDDSTEIGAMLARACIRLPRYKIVGQALDGLEAMEAIRTLAPDLITLDIRMPRMSGIEVLKAIKAEGLRCKVIVFSGAGEEEYRQECLGLGADYFFDKSREPEKVIETLGALHNQ